MFKSGFARIALPLLLSLAALTALGIHARDVSSSIPRIEGGILDLSGRGGEPGGAFELAGEWEFYWDRLLDDTQIKSATETSTFVQAPGEWNDYDLGEGHLPGNGQATYRVHVVGASAREVYGIYVQNMASAYYLYVDDLLIAQNGSVGDRADAPATDYRPQLASFSPANDSFDIVLQVANDAYAVGGMWEPVILGTYEQVYRFSRLLSAQSFFCFGSLFTLCVFFLILFSARHNEKEILALAGIGAMVILRSMLYGDVAIAYLFPGMPILGFGRIDYLTLVWIQFFLLYFIYNSYIGLVKKWYITVLLLYSSISSMFIISFPFETVASAYQIMNYILLSVIAIAVVNLARAAYAGWEGAPTLLGVMGLVLGLILYEMFITDHSILYYVLSNSGIEYMILCTAQCIVIARRYKRAQQMELALLKSQIRPHFVHNALTSIISVSRKDGERARELLKDFSSYLRGFYDYESDELVPIGQELEFIRAYAALEQARFGDRIQVEYRIEVNDALLPPLILQPLVENAFIHGLREQENGGTVLIYAIKMAPGIVRAGVRDDGVGMGARARESGRQGVGIDNINRRLARLYRTQLTFAVPEGGGCEVYMEIPYKEAKPIEGDHYR